MNRQALNPLRWATAAKHGAGTLWEKRPRLTKRRVAWGLAVSMLAGGGGLYGYQKLGPGKRPATAASTKTAQDQPLQPIPDTATADSNSPNAAPADPNAAAAYAAEPNAGDPNANNNGYVDPNSVDPNSVDPNAVAPNAIDPNTVPAVVVDPNAGDPNAGDPNMVAAQVVDPNAADPTQPIPTQPIPTQAIPTQAIRTQPTLTRAIPTPVGRWSVTRIRLRSMNAGDNRLCTLRGKVKQRRARLLVLGRNRHQATRPIPWRMPQEMPTPPLLRPPRPLARAVVTLVPATPCALV